MMEIIDSILKFEVEMLAPVIIFAMMAALATAFTALHVVVPFYAVRWLLRKIRPGKTTDKAAALLDRIEKGGE